MKQHIDLEQWHSLTKRQKEKLVKLSQTQKELTVEDIEITDNFLKLFLAFINIGNMIEILEGLGIYWEDKLFFGYLTFNRKKWEDEFVIEKSYDELCDALFEALKEVL